MNPELTQGINGFGARSRSPLSSRHAQNTFTIFNLNINHTRALPVYDLRGVVKFKAQVASEILPPQEEFSLGGLYSVRGYPAGDYLADIAFQTNLELLIPAFFIPEEVKLPYDKKPLKDKITGVIFFDQGYGEKRGALPTETQKDNLLSAGAGLRINVFDKGVLRMEWGFPFGEDPLTERASSRFHISLDLQY